MNDRDLHALRLGEIKFDDFIKLHEKYFIRQVEYFWRRYSWVHLPVDRSDLFQIAHFALWRAVARYRFRCPMCKRAAASEHDFTAHALERHGRRLDPRTTIYVWVHGKVGSAVDHELTRYRRREKFVGEMPTSLENNVRGRHGFENAARSDDWVPPSLRCSPKQESVATLAEIVEHASTNLIPVERAVLNSLFDGERPQKTLRSFGIRGDSAIAFVERTLKKIANGQ